MLYLLHPWVLLLLSAISSSGVDSFHGSNAFPFKRSQSELTSTHISGCISAVDIESQVQAEQQQQKQQQKLPLHPLGPPESLHAIPVNESVPRHRQRQSQNQRGTTSDKRHQQFQVTRLSNRPHIFHLSNFLSETERHTLLWSTRNEPKEEFYYSRQDYEDDPEKYGRANCHVSWLKPDTANGLSRRLACECAQLLFSDALKTGQGGAGTFEQLQIVRYTKQGKFDLHHDLHHRVVTVLYYLNGVAGTWFPLADSTATTEFDDKQQALQFINTQGLRPGRNGILISGNGIRENKNKDITCNENKDSNVIHIHPGDAIVFYNYDTTRPTNDANDANDESEPPPQVDWRAIHAGLPVVDASEKYIATHWFQGGDFVKA